MDNELQHWGIKGMKWGIRRFQKKDGSLTPEGKKRYDNDDGVSIEERKRRIIDADDPALFYKNRAMFTPQEVKDAYMRFEFEKKIKDLQPKQVSKGQAFVDKYNKLGKNLNDVADTSIKLWNNFAKIYNATPAANTANGGQQLPRING